MTEGEDFLDNGTEQDQVELTVGCHSDLLPRPWVAKQVFGQI